MQKGSQALQPPSTARASPRAGNPAVGPLSWNASGSRSARGPLSAHAGTNGASGCYTERLRRRLAEMGPRLRLAGTGPGPIESEFRRLADTSRSSSSMRSSPTTSTSAGTWGSRTWGSGSEASLRRRLADMGLGPVRSARAEGEARLRRLGAKGIRPLPARSNGYDTSSPKAYANFDGRRTATSNQKDSVPPRREDVRSDPWREDVRSDPRQEDVRSSPWRAEGEAWRSQFQ